jgi:hypothetical protein
MGCLEEMVTEGLQVRGTGAHVFKPGLRKTRRDLLSEGDGERRERAINLSSI